MSVTFADGASGAAVVASLVAAVAALLALKTSKSIARFQDDAAARRELENWAREHLHGDVSKVLGSLSRVEWLLNTARSANWTVPVSAEASLLHATDTLDEEASEALVRLEIASPTKLSEAANEVKRAISSVCAVFRHPEDVDADDLMYPRDEHHPEPCLAEQLSEALIAFKTEAQKTLGLDD